MNIKLVLQDAVESVGGKGEVGRRFKASLMYCKVLSVYLITVM